jgi:hypothetical protein
MALDWVAEAAADEVTTVASVPASMTQSVAESRFLKNPPFAFHLSWNVLQEHKLM